MIRTKIKTRESANSLVYFQRNGTSIVAVATALGGPVAIVRVSGKNLDFLEKMTGKLPSPGTAALRKINDSQGKFLDEAIVLFFKGPKSFTGEDVVEIQGHGVVALVDKMVSEIILLGASPALPGEFSFRAVLNNKMTLDDASRLQNVFASEGIGDQAASKLLGFSDRVDSFVQKSFDKSLHAVSVARGRVEAAIDFSEAEEEQAENLSSAEILILEIQHSLRGLINTYNVFVSNSKIPKIVLFGRPNAGKSTFLNLMCGARRSIVSSQAGTTRDYIEVLLKTSRGQKFKLLDTAGLRNSSFSSAPMDHVESVGIEMSLELMQSADLLLWIKDAREDDLNFGDVRVDLIISQKKCVQILTHADLLDFDKISKPKSPAFCLVTTDDFSSNDDLLKYVYTQIDQKFWNNNSLLLNNKDALVSQRQEIQIQDSLTYIDETLESIRGLRPLELVGDSLRNLEESLRRATGKNVSDDYIGQIFTQFCLGK